MSDTVSITKAESDRAGQIYGTHTLSYTVTHSHVHILPLTDTYTHSYIPIHTHTYTHTFTYTHTHLHTPPSDSFINTRSSNPRHTPFHFRMCPHVSLADEDLVVHTIYHLRNRLYI